MIKLIYETDRFPDYAACYLEYGDESGLNEEDIKNIDSWVKSIEDNNPEIKGALCFEYGEETGFTYYPEFGLGCNCIKIKVFANV